MHRRREVLGQLAPRLPQAYEYPSYVRQMAPPAPVPTRPYWIPGYVAPSAQAVATGGVAPGIAPTGGAPVSLSIKIENQNVNTVIGAGDAAGYIIARSTPGDRIAVVDDATGAESFLVRTPSAVVTMPADLSRRVAAMPRDEVAARVAAAEEAARATAPGGGFPWLALVPVALAVL